MRINSIFVFMDVGASFISQILIVRFLGIGLATDALVLAQSITGTIGAIITVSLQSYWIHKISSASVKGRSLINTISNALGYSFVISALPLGFIAVSSFVWMPLFFNKLSSLDGMSTGVLVLIFALSNAFAIIGIQLGNALRSERRTLTFDLVSFFASILTLIMIVLLKPNNVVWVALLTLAKSIIIFVVLYQIYNRPTFICTGIASRARWRKIKTVLITSFMTKSVNLTDKLLAAQSTLGSVTTLNLSQSGMGAIANIIDRILVSPKTSQFGKVLKMEGRVELIKFYNKALFQVTVCFAIFAIVLIVGRNLFVEIVVKLAAASEHDGETVWLLSVLLLGYLYVAVAGNFPVQAMYSMGDPNTPMKIARWGILHALIIKGIGFYVMGINGLVIGTSVYYMLNMYLMHKSFKRVANENK